MKRFPLATPSSPQPKRNAISKAEYKFTGITGTPDRPAPKRKPVPKVEFKIDWKAVVKLAPEVALRPRRLCPPGFWRYLPRT